MKELVLIRHGQSAWNLENRFTGWVDVDLSDRGVREARDAGKTLREKGYRFDVAMTSLLKRSIRTLWLILEEMDQMYLPVQTDWRLNERHYGALQGRDNKETALKPGDELTVRLVLRTDRDMEYVHLKDQRGSGTEPTNVLSRYKYQDGLGYYEMTKDTASHFYIDYLPKGVYVFEYSVRVQHKGQYQSGMANIQCLYAPEFNSHSASHELSVN